MNLGTQSFLKWPHFKKEVFSQSRTDLNEVENQCCFLKLFSDGVKVQMLSKVMFIFLKYSC